MTAATRYELDARQKGILRNVVETYYDVQEVRIQTEHRIRNYAEHMGLVACIGEEKAQELRRKDDHGKTYKAEVRKRKPNKKKKEPGDPTFVAAFEEAEKDFEGEEKHVRVNKLMLQQETVLKGIAMKHIADHPLWTEWLAGVKGIGPCLAGGLFSWIDVHRAKHAGNIWKYCGQSVIVDSYFCPNCKKEAPADRVPDIRDRMTQGLSHEPPKCDCGGFLRILGHADRRQKGMQTGYNPRAKTLAWKIGESFVKQNADKSGYRGIYQRMRELVESRPCNKVHRDERKRVIPCFDAHKFAKAKRLTVKMFLAHYYMVGRTMAGLPISNPYAFGMMGHDASSFIEPIMDEGEISPEIAKAWRDMK